MRVDLKPPQWATHLLSDLTDWQRQPLPVAELTPFELPDDAYFEYAWRDAQGRRLPDPANDNPRLNPWWEYASNLAGPDYRPEPVAEASSGRPAGSVLRMEVASRILGQPRRVLVYSPAGMAHAALPRDPFPGRQGLLRLGTRSPDPGPPAGRRRDRAGSSGVRAAPGPDPGVRFQSRLTGNFCWRSCCRRWSPAFLATAAEPPGAPAWAGCSAPSWPGQQSGSLPAGRGPIRSLPVLRGHGSSQSFRGRRIVSPERGPGPDARPLRWHLDCGTLEWLIDSNRRLAAALADRGSRSDPGHPQCRPQLGELAQRHGRRLFGSPWD